MPICANCGKTWPDKSRGIHTGGVQIDGKVLCQDCYIEQTLKDEEKYQETRR